MRCSECAGTYRTKHGKLTLTDKHVGQYTVPPIDFIECAECGGRLFSPDAAREVDAARERKLHGTLQSKPLAAFATSTEAATLLGVTRQAFHKNRRISRGFIFQTDFGGKIVYLKESVSRFKKTGDGRFLLHAGTQVVGRNYTPIQRAKGPAKLYSQVNLRSRSRTKGKPAKSSREHSLWTRRALAESGTKHSSRRWIYAQEEAPVGN